jgi:hypothetical protein
LIPVARYPFLLSLPERVLRSATAISGGLLQEIGAAVLPVSVRRTALYKNMVEVTLRFLVEEVGQVRGVYPSEKRLAQDFLLQRGVSHGIGLLGMATLHVSPVWIVAALADASGAGSRLIAQVSQALKDEGLLEKNAEFSTVDQMLGGLEKTSTHLAQTLSFPPLNIESLRREWNQFRADLPGIPAGRLPAVATLERLWSDLTDSAAEQERSVFALCSALAISTAARMPSNLLWLSRATKIATTRTGEVVGSTFLSHYRRELADIGNSGFAEYWKRQFRPYLRAAAAQFQMSKLSSTERLLARTRRT